MSDKVAELIVEVNGKDVGLADILRRTKQQLAEAEAAGRKAGDGLGDGLGQGAAKSQREILQLATAEARLAKEQGDIPGAIQRINAALEQQATRTTQVINAERQLVTLEKERAGGTAQLSGLAQQFGGTLGGLATAAGPVAAGFIAINAASKVLDFAESGAEATQTRAAFDGLARQAGTTGDALLGALRKASKNEISDLNLELAANRAQLLGVASSAQQFSGLMDIARDRAQKMGISTTQAFNDLVTGLGRGSPMILDNLGITLNVAEANETYAKSLGKTAAQLSDAEKKQALINAVLAQGQASIAASGGAAGTAAGSYARLSAAWENARTSAASFVGNALEPAARGAARLLEGTAGLDEAMVALAQNVATGGTATAFMAQTFGVSAGGIDQARQALESWGILAAATDGTAQQAAAGQAQLTGAFDAERSAAGQAEAAHAAYNAQLGATAAQALTAQANSQALAAAQAAIANIASAAANGLISDANAAGVLASQYGIATGEALTLINAQRQLAQAKADATLAQLKAAPAGNTRRDLEDERAARADAARQERAAAAARRSAIDADLAYDRASTAEKLRLTQQELAGATAYSAQWVALKKREQSLQSSLSKSGGRAQLSDQQKLNEDLLKGQQSANDKFEAEDLKHWSKLLDIEKQYAEKSAAAQQKNELDKRQSRFGFYDSLTKATKDIGKTTADALAAEYEKAFQTAQKLSSEGKAALANDYLRLRQEQISADQEYFSALAAAQKDGDSGEVSRLQQMRELRKQFEAEQLRQLEAGGDQNQNARLQAIQEENQRYEEATGGIAESADRAAERKVAAAIRAGKAIDVETAKLDQQAQLYERMGLAPSANAGTPAPTAPTGAAPGLPAASAATAVLDQAVVDAVNGASGAQLGKLDALIAALGALAATTADVGDRVSAVERAVRGLSGRFAA